MQINQKSIINKNKINLRIYKMKHQNNKILIQRMKTYKPHLVTIIQSLILYNNQMTSYNNQINNQMKCTFLAKIVKITQMIKISYCVKIKKNKILKKFNNATLNKNINYLYNQFSNKIQTNNYKKCLIILLKIQITQLNKYGQKLDLSISKVQIITANNKS